MPDPSVEFGRQLFVVVEGFSEAEADDVGDSLDPGLLPQSHDEGVIVFVETDGGLAHDLTRTPAP